ncbi:MAG: GNAT family N-acetyltransferase [Pseudomonadota bacterium]|nr:GNAT family N-acetyltransferase [Pseudomonadota bacterium]
MSAAPVPLRFQIGARHLASTHRRLVRVPLSLGDVLAGRLPGLPPLDAGAQGYLVTSLRAADLAALRARCPGMTASLRQRYTRYWIDLTIGLDAYLAQLSAATRASIRRKTKRIAKAGGGTLDVRRYRTPAEMADFHAIARGVSEKTYQHRLMDSGLPDDPAFVARMIADAAAGLARGWLLFVDAVPAAYLYCPIVGGTVLYDRVGHDPASAHFSPGGVLQLEAMRDLQADPAALRFDFTEGEGQHKRQFATGGEACVDLLLLTPTLANRALCAALDGFDGIAALGKSTVAALGLERVAKRLRR